MNSLNTEKHGPAASPPPVYHDAFNDPNQKRLDSIQPTTAPSRVSDDGSVVTDATLDVDQYPLSSSDKKAVQHELELPSVIFAIPFPLAMNRPAKAGTLPFLLYTLPRATYKKPVAAPLPTGSNVAAGMEAAGASAPGAELVEPAAGVHNKRTEKKGKKEKGPKAPKEKIVKKAERLWQQEVERGDEIHSGRVTNASRWQKVKGGAAHYAGAAIRWAPNSTLEALARLPPRKKLGQIAVLYPSTPYAGTSGALTLDNEEIAPRLLDRLERTRKRAKRTVWLSTALMPVTAAADFFNPCPMFLLEINVAYFAIQLNGARKARAVTAGGGSAFTYHPSSSPSAFDPVLAYVYDQCAHRKPQFFPVSPTDAQSRPTKKDLARGLLEMFRGSVPEEICERHVLDEARVADDLERCLKKGAKEYVKSL